VLPARLSFASSSSRRRGSGRFPRASSSASLPFSASVYRGARAPGSTCPRRILRRAQPRSTPPKTPALPVEACKRSAQRTSRAKASCRALLDGDPDAKSLEAVEHGARFRFAAVRKTNEAHRRLARRAADRFIVGDRDRDDSEPGLHTNGFDGEARRRSRSMSAVHARGIAVNTRLARSRSPPRIARFATSVLMMHPATRLGSTS
jgi:hypothetical protein